MDSPSKITNFDCILHDKDVLRLDIAVNGIILVHVSHCHTNFLDIFYHIFFLKGSFVHSFVKILPRACLKEQVDEFRISSKAIEVDDMRVIKITLDDGFSDELFEALLIQLALLYDRETVNSMCDNILHQMNLTITAFIQKFQHLKYFFLLLIRRVLNYLVLLRLRNDLGGDFQVFAKGDFGLSCKTSQNSFFIQSLALELCVFKKSGFLRDQQKWSEMALALSGEYFSFIFNIFS